MSDNLPVTQERPASGGGALAPTPVPYGSPASGGRSSEYAAALDLRYTDPKRYNSAEHQASLLELAEEKIAAPALDTISSIEAELGEVGWQALAATFPETALSVVEAELIQPLSTGQRAAPEATLAVWEKDAPLAALVGEWGRDAPRMVARVTERMRRLRSRCDAATWNQLADWYDALDGDECVSVTRALSR